MSQPAFRTEHDSMGEIRVPADALYGAQTQRAVDNFPVSDLRMPRAFIQALGLIKAATAEVNRDLTLLDAAVAGAIVVAANEVADGRHDTQFPLDVFQTGSATSTHMNANEVIATLASKRLGKPVHPNDHVNMSQSSNDVIPSAIHVSAYLSTTQRLLPALRALQAAVASRAKELDRVVKTGRTHLMDAMPIRLGQELGGWASQLQHAAERIEATLPRLAELAQGGTAVGTGINAPPEFGQRVAAVLATRTGCPFTPARNYFEALSTQEGALELSGQLKTLSAALMKICADLRWMNSGPHSGLAEISLASLQPGSSIMPGKVNPVLPEAVMLVCAQVMGNDVTVLIGAQGGNFQLNTMLPIIIYNLLQSIELLASVMPLLTKAVQTFTVNEARLADLVGRNPILATALNPVIGYELGAKIVKKALADGRPLKDVAAEMTKLSPQELDRLLDPRRLTDGGLQK